LSSFFLSYDRCEDKEPRFFPGKLSVGNERGKEYIIFTSIK
jgi:hypothetical protein